MKFVKQKIPEVVVIEPSVHGDDRGYFMETFRQDLFDEAIGYKVRFIQDNESRSTRGVLRGLHFQLPPFAQSKLVRVVDGEVLDIAVDIRKRSPTYGKHVSVALSGENKRQLFVPRGFAHGFVVLSDSAIFSYKVDNYYSSISDRGLAFDDESLRIDWKLPDEELQLSEKDKQQSSLVCLSSCFEYDVNYYE
ncbi:MAG: dTDP-4-dehydrorhamnose 3,5-epimerase [Gammaproteobacteria bacterium]|nr:dTDP-4-dehydrorhamnose 3,5-epimerase [Gammaproteobacteria bacterium]